MFLNKKTDFDRISENFRRSEFACKCGCGFDTVDTRLLNLLQTLRDHLMRPIVISSGSRCPKHNFDVGGVDNSFHLYGKAVDISCPGVETAFIGRYLLENLPRKHYGIGIYPTFVHIDVREKGERWRKG